jgi:WD40 repeat protein/uncharacterized caspase-like protein
MKLKKILFVLLAFICCHDAAGQEDAVRTVVQTGHAASIIDSDISADGKLLATVDKSQKVILWNIKAGHQLREFNVAGAKNVYFNSKSTALVVTCQYNTYAYDVVSGKCISHWNNINRVYRGIFTDEKPNPQIAPLKVKRCPSSLKCSVSKSGSVVRVRDAHTNHLIADMVCNVDKVNWAFTQLYADQCTKVPEDTWWSGGQHPVKWNLRTGKITDRLPFTVEKVWQDHRGDLVFWAKGNKIYRHRILTGKRFGVTELKGNGDIHGLAFLSDGKYVVYDRNHRIWQTNVTTGRSDSLEYIESRGQVIGKYVNKGLFSKLTMQDTYYKYTPSNKNKESNVISIGATEFPNKYILFLKSVYTPMLMTLGSKSYVSGANTRDWPYGLCKISPDMDLVWGGLGVYLMQKRVLACHYITSGNTCASPFGSNRIAVGKGNGEIHLFDRSSSLIVEKKQAHQARVNSITQHPSGRFAMATSDDRTISLFHTETNELVAYLTTCNEGRDYIIRTPDNYYMSSQYGTDAIHFAVGTDSYNFDQFDLKYNRPDIVLSRIGLADKKQIDMLYHAYQKRLRRMNYTEEMLSAEFHVPSLKIVNAQQLTQAKMPQQEIKIEASDSKYKINSVNVWINGVPVFGMSGKPVNKNKHISLSLPVTLASGHNTIQVSCLNEKGAESYRETVEANVPAMTGKPHLWIATIGVSKFADQRFNLTYAAKDAKDIERTLSAVNRKDYEEIHTLSLTDADVTQANLHKVSDFLSNAGRNDTAILFYAGHGLMDQSYDYFLGTYDTDFTNPSQKSIPYEEFESLLDGIAPLRKLLLLDACHSGEIDKEDVKMVQANNTSLVKQGITFRNAGIRLPQAVSTTAEEIDELLSDNFSKLQRGSGATIISSSSGLQVSREGDQWNNGLFTYCLIQGLKDKKCDENHDGKISTRELQSYCAAMVQQLSNGNQRPSSRRENHLLDFNIGILTDK